MWPIKQKRRHSTCWQSAKQCNAVMNSKPPPAALPHYNQFTHIYSQLLMQPIRTCTLKYCSLMLRLFCDIIWYFVNGILQSSNKNTGMPFEAMWRWQFHFKTYETIYLQQRFQKLTHIVKNLTFMNVRCMAFNKV